MPVDTEKLYQHQVKILESMVGIYQTELQKMQVKESLLEEKLDQANEESSDIISHLNWTLDQRNEEAADIERQILWEQKDKKSQREEYEHQLETLRQETQQIVLENEHLAKRLAILEEFKVHKEELEANTAALREQEKQQLQDHHRIISNKELKAMKIQKGVDQVISEMQTKCVEMMQKKQRLTDHLVMLMKKENVLEKIKRTYY